MLNLLKGQKALGKLKNSRMNRLKRLLWFEFWPFWLLYIPAYFYWFLLALRAKHPTYFTAVNPTMNNGGALNVSKMAYLSKLPNDWVPKTVQIATDICKRNLLKQIEVNAFSFPLIVKPDKGERGKEVNLVHNIDLLVTAFKRSRYKELLVQEYCNYPNEAGILYYRFPYQNKGHISSVTTKKFCNVYGDGQSTWGELIQSNIRLAHRLNELASRYEKRWNEPAPKGEIFRVEPIGSHNLGTQFLSGQHLRSTSLNECMDVLANQLPGFNYGRFDIKYLQWESFVKGKDFKILEINGVNSEPTHIYDSTITLRKAYKEIFSHMRIIYEISCQNRLLGIQPKPLNAFLYELIKTAFR